MRKRATRHAKPDGHMGQLKQARALALALILCAVVVCAYFWLLRDLSPRGGAKDILLPMVALGVWAASAQPVDLRNRHALLFIALTEIPALVGIVFLTPALALVGVSTGFLATNIQRRGPLAKIVHNVVWYAASIEVGIYFYDHVLGSAAPTSATGWGVALATTALVNIVNVALLVVVVSLVDTAWRMPPLNALAAQVTASAVICTAGGVIVIAVVTVNTWYIVLCVATAVVANIAYRGTVVSRQRYANLEKLYELTRRLGTLSEGRDVMRTVLNEAILLFSAVRAELVLPLGGPFERQASRCWVTGDEPLHFEATSGFSLLDLQVMARGALLLDEAAARSDAQLAKAMAEGGFSQALVAPLQKDEPGAGYLLVAGRSLGDRFKEADLRFLEALAANAGVSLRSSRLLEQLRQEALERQHQAQYDSLTGLPNRSLFNERLGQALELSRPGDRLSVMIIDLDGFKDINDTLGHHTGDEILREVASRLQPLAGGTEVVARLGGDEFAVLLSRAPSDGQLSELAGQILESISQPLAVDDLLLDVRASLGVAVSPEHSQDAGSLMRQADIAMYAAKAAGTGWRFYDKDEDHSTLRSLRLATELRRAMAQDDLDLWFQPVVRIASGEVVGCEALMRWNHDQFGPISPVEFIPVAESAGLIDPLTFWAVEKALSQVKKWRQLVPGLSVSVNLSARSLMNQEVPARLSRCLEVIGIEASALTLELTESSTLSDPVNSRRVLSSLSELGVHLSIDDYGTGFSSLSRLKDLPFDELKIDRSFVKEMIMDKGDEAIVRSTIELARSLGRTVTAEGVEDQATLQVLAALGCDLAQGFFVARPLPAAQCEAWLLAASSALDNTLRVPRLGERGTKQARHHGHRREAGPGQAL